MQTILQTTRRPDVSFFPSGKIDITARVARMLDLHPGDVIDIAINGSEFLLFVRVRQASGNHEAIVRPTKRRSHNFRCYSRRLCQFMISQHCTSHSTPLRVPAGRVRQHEVYGTMVSLVTLININK